MYGDDPKHGVVQGRTFVHPVFRLAFTVPDGFTMQNGTEAVSISGPNAQALFSTRAYEGNLETYVMNVLRDLSKEGGAMRSEERRVGKACVSTCRSGWSAYT